MSGRDGLIVSARLARGGFTLDVDFQAPSAGVTAVFGASGAGKSTLLAAIAGLVPGARVSLDGDRLDALPTERRRVGLVFQDARLFPHLSVRTNLLYGARRQAGGAPPLQEIVGLLGLHGLLERAPGTLSGGERQRVAIGRALLAAPRLLLLDEPLASVDAARRDEILPYLARLPGSVRLPILFVSHALDEVQRLADHLVLLEDGRVTASGPFDAVATDASLPLARGRDAAGVLHGRVGAPDPARRLSRVIVGEGVVLLPPIEGVAEGAAVRLRVPAREVILALAPPAAISVSNLLGATVLGVGAAEDGSAAVISLGVEGGRLLARVTEDAVARLGLRAGVRVVALIKAMSVERV